MYKFTLEWIENGRQRSQTLSSTDITKEPGEIRIGRDKDKCDVILPEQEATVSRLHAAIFYDSQNNQLLLKNLTANKPQPNPIIVDSKKIIRETTILVLGSVINIGKIRITVTQLELTVEKALYGVKCLNGHIIPYDYVGDFCPHCGYGLQAVGTTLIPPKK